MKSENNDKPAFQQPEPSEVADRDLNDVAGGMMNNTFTNCTGCDCRPPRFPY